ncbi:small secreted protein [Pseudomassariella vexata]|uniref:Small secreted protein n=1 Tax=Pseudomassariella vexata TaxID=1141098 RepID=A0A1Y2DRB1_9PEZI|nr:small secreted protein [Pseudomassariella vexata]ORY61729.1 small secreted protein [Pseudomassariella vexata]
MFSLSTLLRICTLAAVATATLDPCTSNTKGKYPANPSCSPSKTSKAIQAAECAYNTRVSGTQTFAVFETDHQYDSSHGAPYGTCQAYTCTAPTDSELTAGEDYWTFYWSDDGEDSGVGTTCIKSPDDGTCGCENSDGTFVYGGSDCS